jgi:hypothetical protein
MLSRKQIAITVFWTGIVALLFQFFSSIPTFAFDAIFGNMWISSVRNWLIDSGLSDELVARYINFVLLNLPIWIILMFTTICFGLISRTWAALSAVALSVWMPVMDFVHTLIIYTFWPPISDADVARQALFGFNMRIVPFCAIVFGLLGFFLGRMMRTSFKKVKERI